MSRCPSPEVHELWSRARASPHPRDLGHLALGFQPLARRELAVAQVLVDADLPAVELPDEQVLLPVAIEVSPAGAGPAGPFDADGHAIRLQPHRRLELRGAAQR